MRRKKPSAKNVWGNLAAVLGGDFFYTSAAAIALDTGLSKLLKLINDTTLRMIEGQVMELTHTHNWHLGKEGYMDIIIAKTAGLMSAACASGAVVADADEEKVGDLAQFGLDKPHPHPPPSPGLGQAKEQTLSANTSENQLTRSGN